MPKCKADVPSIKIFLSHRYKSPEVNRYFYELIAEQADVQFDVDIGLSATNVTRLERLVCGADAFAGLYPFPVPSDAEYTQRDLLEASRYFRLELDIAVRMRKPILVFFDERYGEMLCPSNNRAGVSFDMQEIAGKGGSPQKDAFRKAIRAFVEYAAASKALDLARGRSDTVGRIGVLLPASNQPGAYTPEEIARIQTVMQAGQFPAPQVYAGVPRVDGQLHRWLATLDWLIADVGDAGGAAGVAGFVHGAGRPVLRLFKGATTVAEVEALPAFQGLFGGFEVGYRKDIVFWKTTPELSDELAARLSRIREPTRRIATRDQAEAYFRSASLRNEAVFVSYSGDDRDLGAQIAAAIKRRFQTVFDYRDGASIVPGQPWLKEIFDQLAKAALGVPLLSTTYMKSGNCQHELQEMVAKQDMASMAIIPIKLRDEELELPTWLRNVQYLRYGEHPGVEAAVDRLVQSFDARRAGTAGS